MSVWVYNNPEIKAGQAELKLPFDGFPDLTGIGNEMAMRRLVAAVYADLPPETVVRQAEVTWRNLQLSLGDLLVVPMGDTVSLAEVVRPYRYHVENGEDVHSAEIKWLETGISPRKLSGIAHLFGASSMLQPVEHMEQRKQVYALLKRSYNRFMKWRWLLGIAVAAQMITMLVSMAKR